LRKFPEAKLALAGRDSSAWDSKSTIQTLIDRLPEFARQSVTFTGVLDANDIKKLFHKASLCVFPSHREAFSIVVLEALAAAKPVIYTKIGPGYEVIENGVTGLLCEPRNPVDLCEKITTLLGNSDLRRMLATNGRKMVESRYALKTILKINVDFYEACIRKHASLSNGRRRNKS
jgi:glycosyltransferase involved in cell wall biosynthesis